MRKITAILASVAFLFSASALLAPNASAASTCGTVGYQNEIARVCLLHSYATSAKYNVDGWTVWNPPDDNSHVTYAVGYQFAASGPVVSKYSGAIGQGVTWRMADVGVQSWNTTTQRLQMDILNDGNSGGIIGRRYCVFARPGTMSNTTAACP